MRTTLAALGTVFTLIFPAVAGSAQLAVDAAARGQLSCAGAVSWQKARSVVGKVATIRGPVVGTYYASGSNGSPTFLNLGVDYPSTKRFTVVIWGSDRHKFGAPERRYARKTICVRGSVEIYRGVPEIEAASPSQIRVVGS